jgi:hypothetical protein
MKWIFKDILKIILKFLLNNKLNSIFYMNLTDLKAKGVTHLIVQLGKAWAMNPKRFSQTNSPEEWVQFQAEGYQKRFDAPNVPVGVHDINAFEQNGNTLSIKEFWVRYSKVRDGRIRASRIGGASLNITTWPKEEVNKLYGIAYRLSEQIENEEQTP